MKKESEILRRTERYRKELLNAMHQKENLGGNCGGELDLKILALVHKLEILFWILEINLPHHSDRLAH